LTRSAAEEPDLFKGGGRCGERPWNVACCCVRLSAATLESRFLRIDRGRFFSAAALESGGLGFEGRGGGLLGPTVTGLLAAGWSSKGFPQASNNWELRPLFGPTITGS
jgi:hypothetical protein